MQIRGDSAVRTALFVAAAVIVIPLLFPLLTGRVFTYDDLRTFHLPLRHLYRAALRAGDSTLWTPSLFSGLYLLGEGQAGTLHPWHWLIYRGLPLNVAFNVELLANYLLAFSGMYVLLRRVPLAVEAAAFGAILAAFSGFNLLHAMHVNAVAILAHLPWLLAAIDALLSARQRTGAALAVAAIGVVIASQWLLGFPQTLYLTALLAVPFTIIRGWRVRRRGRIILCAAAGCAGTLIGAVQWLPMLAAARLSERADATQEFLLSYSLHPVNLLQLVAPYAIANRMHAPPGSPMHEFGLYGGAVAPIAVVWLLIGWRRLRHRALAAACLTTVALALVLALGRFTPLGRLLVAIPGYPPFRAPARHIFLAHFAFAVLGAILIEELLSRARDRAPLPTRTWMVYIPPGLGLLAVVVVRHLTGVTPAPLSQALAGVLPAFAAATLTIAATRGTPGAVAMLVLCAALDLGVWGLMPLWRSTPATLSALASQADVPRRAGPGAYVHVDTAYGNVAVLRGLRLSNGYVALPPKRQVPESLPVVLRISGVSWTETDVGWVSLADPMPRARLVTRAIVSSNPAGDIHAIDHTSSALIDRDAPPLAGPVGTTRIIRDAPGRLVVATAADHAQLLVTTERFDEGWVAARGCIDGVRRVNGDFLGCVVEAGTSTAVFEFDPPSFRRGRRIAVMGAAALIALMSVAVLIAGRNRAG